MREFSNMNTRIHLPDNIDIQALFADCDIDFNDPVIFPKERSAEFKEWQEREAERLERRRIYDQEYKAKNRDRINAQKRKAYANETPEQMELRKIRVERSLLKNSTVAKAKATNMEAYKADRERENARKRQAYANMTKEQKQKEFARALKAQRKRRAEHRPEDMERHRREVRDYKLRYPEKVRAKNRAYNARKRAEKLAQQQTENKDT